MPTYHYSLGPWAWQSGAEPGWVPPANAVACVDLRSLPSQALAGAYGDRPYGFFATDAPLDSAYAALGQGDCREIQVTGALQDAWESLLGYRPQGAHLVDLLWDQLTQGSDPSGDTPTSPLLPTVRGVLELHLAGHSRVKSERFRWGAHSHTAKVRDVLHRDYRQMHADVAEGRSRPDHDRRVLDFWAEQYRLGGDAWRELVPPELRKGHQGRLPHETELSDSFDRADSTNIGADWDEVLGDWSISGNRLNLVDTADNPKVRHTSDLSSADHYAQMLAVAEGGGAAPQETYFAACVRFSTSANTHYAGWIRRNATTSRRLEKVVTGTQTQLSADNTAATVTYTVKTEMSGSTLKLYKDGAEIQSVTDTAITGNLRTGLGARGGASAGSGAKLDDYLSGDLATGHPAQRRFGLLGPAFRPVEIGREGVRIF